MLQRILITLAIAASDFAYSFLGATAGFIALTAALGVVAWTLLAASANTSKTMAVELRLGKYIAESNATFQTHDSAISTAQSDITTAQNNITTAQNNITTLQNNAIDPVSPPTKASTNPTPTSGNPGSTYSEAYLTALAGNVNSLLAYTNELAGCVNGIYDQLQSAGVFT
jgi:hypothetical protein